MHFSFDERIKLNQRARALDEKQTDIATQKKDRETRLYQKTELSRWNALHSLIGSADGKKYRNFAQGITFELMVSHA
ncbi:hypothetical protein, partial [Desulfobacula sp.]